MIEPRWRVLDKIRVSREAYRMKETRSQQHRRLLTRFFDGCVAFDADVSAKVVCYRIGHLDVLGSSGYTMTKKERGRVDGGVGSIALVTLFLHANESPSWR